jgi:hypothetical protein
MSWIPAYPVTGRFGLRREARAGCSSAAGTDHKSTPEADQ